MRTINLIKTFSRNLVSTATLAALMLSISGCLPDNLTKWEEPQQVVAPSTGVNVTGSSGTVNVPAPSGGTAPTSFSYPASSIGLPLGKAVSGVEPTFVGETGTSNTYIFSSYDATGTVATSLSTVGLTLNQSTGEITGTPSSIVAVMPAVFKIKAYHVESGSTLSADSNLSISFGTDFSSSSFKIVYPQGANQKLVLKVGSVTGFEYNCTPDCYVSNAAGAKAVIDYVDATNKELYVTVSAPSDQSIIFAVGDSIDNRDTFISADTTISQVTYSVNVATGADMPVPYFTSTPSATELNNYITWSVNPAPPGGLTDGATPASDPNSLYFYDRGASGGSFNADTTRNTLSTTTFTVIAKNAIDQTESITVTINLSNGPTELSYSNQLLLTVDDNARFKLGSPISSSGTGKGVVIRKAGSTLLGVKVSQGEFKVDDRLDDTTTFNTERAVVSAITSYNAILKFGSDVSAVTFAAGNCIMRTGATNEMQGIISYTDSTNPILFSLDNTPAVSMFRNLAPGYLLTTTEGDQGYVDFLEPANGAIYFTQTVGNGLTETTDVFLGTENDIAKMDRIETEDALSSPSTAVSDVYVRLIDPTGSGNAGFTQTAANLTLSSCAGADITDPAFINAPFISTKLATTTFKKGTFITTGLSASDTETGSVGMVVDDSITNGTYKVSVLNGIIPFNSRLDDQNPYVSSAATVPANTVTEVTPLSLYVAYRGESFTLIPTLTKGENLSFYLDSTSDILPAGLSLSSTTGIISGTPTESSATKTLKIVAENSIGNASMVVKIRVIDRFAVLNLTDNATSFHLHRGGKGNMNTSCQITSDHINGTSSNVKDVQCFMEAGELDLYFSGFKAGIDVGKGLCEYVSMSPFYFFRYAYKSSSDNAEGYKVIEKFTVPAACTGLSCQYTDHRGQVVTADCDDLSSSVPASCDSDYSKIIGTGNPNCDDGDFREVTYTLIADGIDALSVCGDDATEASTLAWGNVTSCGGKRANCIDGPVKDLITDVNQLDIGINSKIYDSFEGLSGSPTGWNFAAPINKTFITNKRLANFTHHNACIDAASNSDRYVYDTDNWSTFTYYGLHKVYILRKDGSCTVGGTASDGGNYTGGIIYDIVDDTDTNAATDGGAWVYIYNPTVSISNLVEGETICNNAGTARVAKGFCNGEGTPIKMTEATCEADAGTWIPRNDPTSGNTELNPFLGGRPFYTVSCLDSSYDVKARIRIMVRDWNRTFSPGFGIDHVNLTTLGNKFYADSVEDSGFGSYDDRSDWDRSPGSASYVNQCINNQFQRTSTGVDYSFPEDDL